MQLKTSTTHLGRTAAGALTAVLMAAGTLALAPAAQASTERPAPRPAAEQSPVAATGTKVVPGATAQRSTNVTLVNKTGQNLVKTWEKLDHGCWTTNMLPPDNIPNGKSPSWASESCGFATGTEGRANYALPGGEIKLHWNNPYVGSNSYECVVPSGYSCYRSGGGGDNASVTFTVQSAWAAKAQSPAAVVPGATAARSTTVTLTNNSGKLLVRDGSWLGWGIWSDGMLPPSMVQPGVTAKWASESEGLMTGTEGQVTFTMTGESNKVTVYWNNPYVGSNSYSCSVPSGYTCTRSGGGGDNASASFNVSKS
ncbi:Crystal protein ET79 [Streptomyces sp. NPDC094032]|uniref:Crystal protein ET79 n=1 Tax=Streptomyces sp. NPDC094032 TaxID=3155308 RepID=UPI00332F8CF9